MIDVNQLRKGTTFQEDDQIWKVINYHHHKPGRGNATIRLTVRNMRTGTTREMTYNSGERVQEIEVEDTNVEYLYLDGEFLTFMDLETFDQPQLRRDVFGDDFYYLKEGMQIRLFRFGDEIIDYELPTMSDYKVVEAESGFTGDTAGPTAKRVTIETGLQVQVPTFVNVGDTIRIKTEDASYVTRV